MIKISVIIPTYKPKSYIWQCLNSVRDQTFDKSEYEVIVVLNGCNEPWKSEITDYINKNLKNNIVRFYQTNLAGVSNARNWGLDFASGDYIAFLDDDDYISPNYLSELYKEAGKSIVSVSNTLAFTDNGTFYSYHITENFAKIKDRKFSSILEAKSFFSGPCMKLFHKNIIRRARFNTLLVNGEDTLFVFEISDAIKKVSHTNDSAIYYRRVRETSATTRNRSNKERIQSDLIQLKWIITLYVKRPFEYNFLFFILRVVGCIYYIFKFLLSHER